MILEGRLTNTREQALVGQLAETDTAQLEFTDIETGTTAAETPVHFP
jgi:hypothetical protein